MLLARDLDLETDTCHIGMLQIKRTRNITIYMKQASEHAFFLIGFHQKAVTVPSNQAKKMHLGWAMLVYYNFEHAKKKSFTHSRKC